MKKLEKHYEKRDDLMKEIHFLMAQIAELNDEIFDAKKEFVEKERQMALENIRITKLLTKSLGTKKEQRK